MVKMKNPPPLGDGRGTGLNLFYKIGQRRIYLSDSSFHPNIIEVLIRIVRSTAAQSLLFQVRADGKKLVRVNWNDQVAIILLRKVNNVHVKLDKE